eukprot:4464997-Pleurochrysis_carterae.AAC.1
MHHSKRDGVSCAVCGVLGVQSCPLTTVGGGMNAVGKGQALHVTEDPVHGPLVCGKPVLNAR